VGHITLLRSGICYLGVAARNTLQDFTDGDADHRSSDVAHITLLKSGSVTTQVLQPATPRGISLTTTPITAQVMWPTSLRLDPAASLPQVLRPATPGGNRKQQIPFHQKTY
jgi:hypothetical protein